MTIRRVNIKTTITVRLTRGLKDKMSGYAGISLSDAVRMALHLGSDLLDCMDINEKKEILGSIRAEEVRELYEKTLKVLGEE